MGARLQDFADLAALREGPRAALLHNRLPDALRPRVSEEETDETCPISTEGWTRRVHFVREGGAGGGPSREWPSTTSRFTLASNPRPSTARFSAGSPAPGPACPISTG